MPYLSYISISSNASLLFIHITELQRVPQHSY